LRVAETRNVGAGNFPGRRPLAVNAVKNNELFAVTHIGKHYTRK
jgi:hypothetical protein